MNDTPTLRPHQLIRASAGSGKTYRLVRRLLGLLADAESPDSILAATFSRKAAGEFRRKLLSAIADAVSDPAKLAVLAEEIGHPSWGRDDFLGLLSKLVRDPDSLRLSTIDAFFFELVGLFRFELGLGPNVTLADENADGYEMRDLLRRIFATASDEVRQAVFHLIEEDRSTESVRSFQEVLEKWISDSLDLYRSSPDPLMWGVLPPGINLSQVNMEAWSTCLSHLQSALDNQTLPPESVGIVQKTLIDLSLWDLSPALSGEMQKWIKAGAETPDKLLAGKKYFRIGGKNVTFSPDAGEALVHLSRLFHSYLVKVAIDNTRSAYQFLRSFSDEYEERRLKNGLIRFGDLPYLLSTLETVEGAMLAYRLDARLKHWLLDEFQDTSRSQWRVVHPLIDELFFDSEENRTFFCVGDPKQAIYGWRQGDSRLFDEIRQRYEHFEPRPLEAMSIAKTYRCSPEVISFTNQLFGSHETFPADLDSQVSQRWLDHWRTHESARTHLKGHIEVHYEDDSDLRDNSVVEFLLQERPWEFDQTVAILCRGNKAANRFEALLRGNGIPSVRDGALSISNDFVSGRLLLACFQVLLHPGDTMALSVLRECSASEAIQRFCSGEITATALRTIWEGHTLTEFLTQFEIELAKDGWIDEAERRCLRSVFNLLNQIESSAGSSLREMVLALRSARLDDTGSSGSVQILTIHRSKGLEFDMVILPDLDKISFGGMGKSFWSHDENGHIDRILESVTKDVRSTFPPLDDWGIEIEQDSAFENLCVHYVAFTRAITSLHIFLENEKRKSKTGIHKWLQQAYEIEFQPGSVFQLGEKPTPATKAQPKIEKPVIHPPVSSPRDKPTSRRLLTPSGGDAHQAGSPFAPGRNSRLSFGHSVHETLAKWEWPIDEWDPEGIDSEIVSLIESAFTAPAIRNLLQRPADSVTVWRERPFDALIQGTWSSGVFDRVHLHGNWKNGSGSATIIDYKTDSKNTESPPAAYQQQLNIYRSALARILAMDESRISAKLVFLRSGTVVEI